MKKSTFLLREKPPKLYNLAKRWKFGWRRNFSTNQKRRGKKTRKLIGRFSRTGANYGGDYSDPVVIFRQTFHPIRDRWWLLLLEKSKGKIYITRVGRPSAGHREGVYLGQPSPGSKWGHSGSIWGHSKSKWVHSGSNCEHMGSIFGQGESKWFHSGSIWGHSGLKWFHCGSN